MAVILDMQISIYVDLEYATLPIAAILDICKLADFRIQPG